MKKEIVSFKIWKNGKQFSATHILVYSAYDDFNSYATLAYQLFDKDSNLLDSGNVTMSGESYLNWGKNSTDLNLEAVQFVCNAISIKLK